MKFHAIAAVCIVGALTACSPRAGSVAPIPMGEAYSSTSCDRIAAALTAERSNVEALSKAQNGAATADAIGVFLFAVPVSNITGGNKAGDLGTAKGKVLALESRARACGLL